VFENYVKQIQTHALEEAPNECCGLVTASGYVWCENVADDPKNSFVLDPRRYAAVASREEILAVVHSHVHPNADCPTKLDMEQQIQSKLPWGITHVGENGLATAPFWFGDSVPIPPLIGRTFRHGVTDCYALVRDWFRLERDIQLPIFPREDYWWEDGEDVLLDNYKAMGFEPLSSVKDLQIGDGILGTIAGRVTNHCAVYVGQGLILHHLPNRLSRVDPIHMWMKHLRIAVRYVG